MPPIIKIVEFAFGCIVLWAAIHWFGAGAVALALAVPAVFAGGMTLRSVNEHGADLQRLRERLSALERGSDRWSDQQLDRVEALERQLDRLTLRVDGLTRPPVDDE